MIERIRQYFHRRAMARRVRERALFEARLLLSGGTIEGA